jgi:hypothetical protein
MKRKMPTKLFVLFAAAGLSIASAKTYSIRVPDHAVVEGSPVKAGTYRVKVEGDKATLINEENNKAVQVTAKTESADTKFTETKVRLLQGDDGLNHIQEIDLGGTNLKLEFTQ